MTLVVAQRAAAVASAPASRQRRGFPVATLATRVPQLLAFMREHVPERTSPMCGNSICQDRRFMARWLPGLEAYFHYRNLDVSTLKELARRWKPAAIEGLKKAQSHTALADVHESIDELLHYRRTLLAA